MEATKKNESKTKSAPDISADLIMSLYKDQVLEKGHIPVSVYKFCKANAIFEAEFHSCFGSFEGIQLEIWNSFYRQSIDKIKTDASYEDFSNREKMLNFFHAFFEILTLNQKYVLFALKEHKEMLNNLRQLMGLRYNIKQLATRMIEEENTHKNPLALKHRATIFSEEAWLQTILLLENWMDDNSNSFKNTDIAIEKSVQGIFYVYDSSPLERVLNFGKFLWKEERAYN